VRRFCLVVFGGTALVLLSALFVASTVSVISFLTGLVELLTRF